jgi:hypothetical protein
VGCDVSTFLASNVLGSCALCEGKNIWRYRVKNLGVGIFFIKKRWLGNKDAKTKFALDQ